MTRRENTLYFYDCDGALLNEAQVSFSSREVGILELDQFIGDAKLESGVKHCHLVVRSPAGTTHICRMHVQEAGAFMAPSKQVSSREATFFPLTLVQDRSYVLGVVNHGTAKGAMKVRLLVGTRSPEISVTLPPLGSKMISIPAEFPDYIGIGAEKPIQGYIRVSVQGESPLGVHLIERNDTVKDREAYSSIS